MKVADRLAKEFKISVVYSSDLNRALETARTIAKTCGGLEVLILVSDALCGSCDI